VLEQETHLLHEKTKLPVVTDIETRVDVRAAGDEPCEVDSGEVGASGEVGERSDGFKDLGRDRDSKRNVEVEGRRRDGCRLDLG